MSVEREALVKELRALRRGQGATLSSISASPYLVGMLGGGGVSPVNLRDALISAIRQLPDSEVLLNAYGLSDPPVYGNLTERRAALAVEQDKHFDTIENYENRGIEQLATLLHASSLHGSTSNSREYYVHAHFQDGLLAFVREIRFYPGTRQYDESGIREYVPQQPSRQRSLRGYFYLLKPGPPAIQLDMTVSFSGSGIPASCWHGQSADLEKLMAGDGPMSERKLIRFSDLGPQRLLQKLSHLPDTVHLEAATRGLWRPAYISQYFGIYW